MKLRRTLIATFAVLALLCAACSKKATPAVPAGSTVGTSSTAESPASGGDALSGVAAAIATATEQGSVKMGFEMRVEGTAGSTPPPGAGAGAFSMKGTSEVDYANNASHSIITMPMLGKMETIQIGNVSYVKSDMMSGLTGSSKQQWMKSSASSADSTGVTGSLGGSDPTAMFAFLAGASSLDQVGTEQIDGVETVHYTGTIDASKIAQNLPADQAKQVRDSIAAVGMKEMPFDVWVGSDGLVRRVAFTFDLSAMSGGASPAPGTEMLKNAKMVITIDLFDYGVPVSIEAPPASEIAKMPDMPSGLMPGGMPSGMPTTP
jgi:hypothetical protein